MIDTDISWSLVKTWNLALEKSDERPVVARNHIWASELGGSLIDRYYKMKGVKPTNPPNLRSLRKFEAGNLWEWILGFILKRSGLYLGSQDHLSYQYPGLLEVTGRLDYLAGGKPDWERAEYELDALDLPPYLKKAADALVGELRHHLLISNLAELKKIVLEIKSVSTFMFERHDENSHGDPHHNLQLFHYLKSLGMDEGHLIYICKDDSRMLEFGIFNPSPTEDAYKEDIEAISHYIASGEVPPKEPEVVFDRHACKFSKNWQVEYSNYLSMLYGYPEPMDFADKWAKTIPSYNRVIKRMVEGNKLTALNCSIIEEMKEFYPELDEAVEESRTKKEVSHEQDTT